MAVTSRGLITPDQTDQYNLVADLNTFSSSINEALEDGANTYRGTSAARTSFTSAAPEGTIWVDTNGEKIIWVKQGILWNRIWPIPDPPGITVAHLLASGTSSGRPAGAYAWLGPMRNYNSSTTLANGTDFGPFIYRAASGSSHGSGLEATVAGVFRVAASWRLETSQRTALRVLDPSGSSIQRSFSASAGDRDTISVDVTLRLQSGDRLGVEAYHYSPGTGERGGGDASATLSLAYLSH